MALRGNLRDFSLPDVFQLVTFSRKTGVLRIVREDDAQGSVWFREGEVFFASSNWHSAPLGERLVSAQRITAQALKRGLQLRSGEGESGRRLGQILVDEGYITETVLEAFVTEQIQDTIFDLMRWDEGDFDFESMPDVVDEDIGLTVSIENVVMEGSRRLEEWGRIRKKIPSMEVVFKMATAPGEGTFEISLKPIEWQLLLQIDGSRSVAELAVESERTDFEVARILYGLFSAGLLEFATDEEIAENRAERQEREARLAVIESERRAAQEAETKAAQQREAALAEEARKRAAAEAQATEVATKSARDSVAEQAARDAIAAGPAEVPEFLGGAASAPNADDQAVLDEFMGAVLEAPAAAVPEAIIPEPAVPHEPYVPAEEPAFFGAGSDQSDIVTVGVPSVEDLLGDLVDAPTVVEPEPEIVGSEPAHEVEDTEPEFEDAEPEVVEHESQIAGSDFERGLMGMGLGELPSDLLEPVSAPTEVSSFPEPEIPLDLVTEPMSLRGDDPDAAWMDEPAADEPTPEDIGAGLLDVEALIGSETEAEPSIADALIELSPATEASSAQAESLLEGDPDFTSLLESLDVDAEDPLEKAIPDPVEAGFDVDLLLESDVVETGGVISTDPYLGDSGMEELHFSGGLTDELSALTGADRRHTSRPQASVNALPEEGSGVLHRDVRVDKATVLKIIDGIKNL
jgi:hypothetical protein